MTLLLAAETLVQGPPAPFLPGGKLMCLYFFGALLVAVLGTLCLIRSKARMGIDAPDKRRKFHEKPIMRLGGAPLFIAFLGGLAVAIKAGHVEWARWLPVIL